MSGRKIAQALESTVILFDLLKDNVESGGEVGDLEMRSQSLRSFCVRKEDEDVRYLSVFTSNLLNGTLHV
ncbi:MAG: hypothetical protein Q9172_003419 [Xanthocarpia lactea]